VGGIQQVILLFWYHGRRHREHRALEPARPVRAHSRQRIRRWKRTPVGGQIFDAQLSDRKGRRDVDRGENQIGGRILGIHMDKVLQRSE
jgi:hypothetical protein